MKRLIDKDMLIEQLKVLQEAYDPLKYHSPEIAGSVNVAKGALWMTTNMIEAQPTIDAVPQWIPCSERMPQWWWINPEADEKERIWDGEKVIVCGTIGDWPYSGVACGMYGPDGWSIEDDAFSDDDVPVAWMPLPVPYEEEE